MIGFLETSESRAARLDDANRRRKSHVLDVEPHLRVTPRGETVWVYSSHWMTCPAAKEYRVEQIAANRSLASAAEHAAPAEDSPTRPEGPSARSDPENRYPCDVCGKRNSLAPGLPVCVGCWNEMSPADQAKTRTLEQDAAEIVNRAAAGEFKPGCNQVALPGGGGAIVCMGRRGRKRR